jgi:hypothetical protein
MEMRLDVARVTRVVSAIAAGRILNTKTGHSQIMGGIVWGIGMALHEETVFDHRFGRIMNAKTRARFANHARQADGVRRMRCVTGPGRPDRRASVQDPRTRSRRHLRR